MKILLLNPHINAEHSVVKSLKKNGMALLLPSNAEEAWQMLRLHGDSVDLAVIHREGIGAKASEEGLSFVFKVKGDPGLSDLPMILSSETWKDPDFVKHQESSLGVHAYLRFPYQDTQLLETIHGVLGQSSTQSPKSPLVSGDSGSGFELEETKGGHNNGDINLELPPVLHLEPSVSLPTANEVVKTSRIQAPKVSFFKKPFFKKTAEPEKPKTVPPLEMHDEQVAEEMPYLFKKKSTPKPSAMNLNLPVGDALVPGGAGKSPDLETLKNYLMLREQDVAVLSNQLKAIQEMTAGLESQLRQQRAKNAELIQSDEDQKRKIADFEAGKSHSMDSLQNEIVELRFQARSKSDQARLLETQVREASEEMERLKERVRSDIRKIRVREKELENKLEIMRRDSEALIGARETKIVELKRKLDLVEFNLDLLQDKYMKEKDHSLQLRERLAKAAQVVRVAGGMLDTNPSASASTRKPQSSDDDPSGKREAS